MASNVISPYYHKQCEKGFNGIKMEVEVKVEVEMVYGGIGLNKNFAK